MEGAWAKDDLRRAFVDGVKWWNYVLTRYTLFPSERDVVENEAESRYPNGKLAEDTPEICNGSDFEQVATGVNDEDSVR